MLKTVYPNQGIIQRIKTRYNPVEADSTNWISVTTESDAVLLDTLLKTEYGIRKLSAFGQMLNDTSLTSDELETQINEVTDIIYTIHRTAWDRLWSDYISEYNPLYNVDATETKTHDFTTAHSGQGAYTDSGTDTTTNSGTDKSVNSGTDKTTNSGTDTTTNSGTDSTSHTGTNSTIVEDSSQGFNSTDYVGTNKTETTETPSNTTSTDYGLTTELSHGHVESTEHGLTTELSHGHVESTEHGKKTTETRDFTDTDNGTETYIRKGNIGVTKTQELLKSDLELWQSIKSLFYHNIIKDIVNDITYPIFYES